ncbi:MAG: hypothetical protein ACLR7U_06540 [Ruthenibacterium lactatiformans]
MEKISRKNWALIWVLGMAGQICWNIENSWFNTFVYRKIAPDPSIVAWMVGVSAVVSTFCTFLIGTASDRLGRRRPFIAFGYILWACSPSASASRSSCRKIRCGSRPPAWCWRTR